MNDASTVAPGQKAIFAAANNNKPWEVTVEVYLHSEAAGDFTIESYLQTQNSRDLIFSNSGHDGFDVTFNLTDETGLGYQFPSGPLDCDAIWSQLGNLGCPSAPGQWDVFDKKSIVVSHKGMVVTARNPNQGSAVGEFRYTLNVTKDGGAHYLPLDPGGINQNGSTK